jgi:phage-related protein
LIQYQIKIINGAVYYIFGIVSNNFSCEFGTLSKTTTKTIKTTKTTITTTTTTELLTILPKQSAETSEYHQLIPKFLLEPE